MRYHKSMSKFEKLKQKIRDGHSISYDEAENFLLKIGFAVRVRGSHHVFSKDGYEKNISIKKRSQLMAYQMRLLEEVLEDEEKK